MSIPFSTLLGQLNAEAPGEIISGKRFSISRNFIESALCNDLAAMFSCTRANINDVIGSTHSVLIMFNYQQRVTQVAQACQRLDQTLIIALVEANTWFIKNVEHSHQSRADLRCQAYALCFSTRKTSGGPIQGQVFQADIDQELETSTNLFEHLPGYKAFSLS